MGINHQMDMNLLEARPTPMDLDMDMNHRNLLVQTQEEIASNFDADNFDTTTT